MQSLQHAQRIQSSAGCSTSNSFIQAHASRSCRAQQRSDTLTSSSPVCFPTQQSSRARCQIRHVKLSSRRRKSKRHSSSQVIPFTVTADVNTPLETESAIITNYVAETNLPTRTGKYRVRAYRHSVSSRQAQHPGSQAGSVKL